MLKCTHKSFYKIKNTFVVHPAPQYFGLKELKYFISFPFFTDHSMLYKNVGQGYGTQSFRKPSTSPQKKYRVLEDARSAYSKR